MRRLRLTGNATYIKKVRGRQHEYFYLVKVVNQTIQLLAHLAVAGGEDGPEGIPVHPQLLPLRLQL